jgi:hypothetical protein
MLQLHPNPKIQEAAVYISQTIGTYIEHLNTNEDLCVTPILLVLN